MRGGNIYQAIRHVSQRWKRRHRQKVSLSLLSLLICVSLFVGAAAAFNGVTNFDVPESSPPGDTVSVYVEAKDNEPLSNTYSLTSFEHESPGQTRPNDPMFLYNNAGTHRISTEHASDGDQSFYTGDAPVGDPSAIAVKRNLSDVKYILIDVFAVKNNPSHGNIKVSLGGAGYGNSKTNIKNLHPVIGEGQWSRDVKVNVSEYHGEHTVTFWVDGDNNAYWDNIRISTKSERVTDARSTSTSNFEDETTTSTGHTTEIATEAASSEGVGTNAPESRVFLDTNRTLVGRVTIDGTPYAVYRYENMLPYASGIEVYGPEGRVEDEDRAQAVFTVLAWQQAVSELSAEDISTLKDIKETSQRINSIVSPPLNVLNKILQFQNELKQMSFMGTSAWDILADNYPGLEEFFVSVRDTKGTLQDWQQASSRTNQNLGDVIRSLEQIQSEEADPNYEELGTQFAEAMAGLDELSSESDQLAEELSSVSNTASEIASAINSISLLPGELAQPFRAVASTLSTAESEVQSFSDTLQEQRSELGAVRNTAQGTQDSYINAYKTRSGAETKVYGTLGGLLLALFIIVGLLLRRRGADEDKEPRRSTGQDEVTEPENTPSPSTNSKAANLADSGTDDPLAWKEGDTSGGETVVQEDSRTELSADEPSEETRDEQPAESETSDDMAGWAESEGLDEEPQPSPSIEQTFESAIEDLQEAQSHDRTGKQVTAEQEVIERFAWDVQNAESEPLDVQLDKYASVIADTASYFEEEDVKRVLDEIEERLE